MGELRVSHGGGLTSCLSVILHEVSLYRERAGIYPTSIDASGCFRTTGDRRAASRLLAPSSQYFGEEIKFDHGQQMALYNDLDLTALRTLARFYCWPSQEVIDHAQRLKSKVGGRTAVLYRGLDKSKEIPRHKYEAMFEAARKAGGQYVVQTDELEFLKAFTRQFPDSIPMPGSRQRPYSKEAVIVGDTKFAVRFLASLYAISQATKMVTTTGNTALWPYIWRGHTDGCYQITPQE